MPTGTNDSSHRYTNHLISQSSPYLLQHAHNPVDWYPWGDEALAKAKAENKMLVISIGYAACHWCHVMEHESFEDSTVAAVMNEHFVSVKVDREERPDIDDVYMTACHLASGKGCGWPLNAFALPDGRPVWAGTYFPQKEWLNVLNYFIELREKEPEKLEQYATQLASGIARNEELEISGVVSEFTGEALDGIASAFVANVDKTLGGRVGAPKFPMPNNYAFLMRYAFMRDDAPARDAVLTTLDKMANGGIYDQVGGGFARYSVDARWHVPHFEKMLYDNGQHVSLYANGYQYTGNEKYAQIVRETITFIERELSDDNGGFYSSLDADSDGEEGKFYVWTQAEIDALFPDEGTRALLKDYYDIRRGGNWEHGKNVLQILSTEDEVMKRHDLTSAQFQAIISDAKSTLLAAREHRIRPGLDDKILTSWNALMLKGYVDAYRALGDQAYLERALKNAEFLKNNVQRPDGGLNRNYKDGKSVINAFLDDYALLMEAWISLYQVTYDEWWLNDARRMADYVHTHFFDEATGLYFYTSDIDPPLVARKKEISDNVIPASNSILAKAFHKLGLYFYDTEMLDRAEQMLQVMAPQIISSGQPSFYSNWCDLYADHAWPLFEIAIVGNAYEDLNQEMQSGYVPHAIFLGGAEEGELQLLRDKLQDGETYIYVCQNKVCKFPVTNVEEALGLME